MNNRLLAAAFLVAGVTVGCVSHTRYRSHYPSIDEPLSARNAVSALEQTTNYLLGIVEIDDQGWLWDRQQLDSVMKRIDHDMTGSVGVQVYVFVHGWQHNAEYDDENLVTFRNMLTALDEREKRRSARANLLPRKTVGIYVGWRGASHPIRGVRAVTFWNRKRTAHEVGRGALAELLLRVERFVNTNRGPYNGPSASRLVVIGHSFGGAATYSALAPIFMERLLEPRSTNSARLRGFGDLVMLINPAFEAARYGVLRDAALAEWGTLNQNGTASPLNLIVLTSVGDAATGTAFPMGRSVSAAMQKHQTHTQFLANITAIGHYHPFITHDLEATPPRTNQTVAAAPPRPEQVQMDTSQITSKAQVDDIAQQSIETTEQIARDHADPKARNKPLQLSHTRLRGRPHAANEPFLVVAVDKKIIPNHGGIEKPILLSFLTDYLGYLSTTEGRAAFTAQAD